MDAIDVPRQAHGFLSGEEDDCGAAHLADADKSGNSNAHFTQDKYLWAACKEEGGDFSCVVST